MVKENNLGTILDSEEPALGAQTATMSQPIIEVYGNLGMDFVWLDLEHKGPSPYDSDTLENFVRTAENTDIDLIVRLPTGDSHLIRKVLDTGVRNIIVPRVETAEEVRRAVKAAQFKYDGNPGDRGASFSRANNWGQEVENYAEKEDSSVRVGAMIENTTAVTNLDDILSIPQLGFVWIGTGDLSVSLGQPIDSTHSDIKKHIEIIEEKTNEYDIPLGRSFSTLENIYDAVDRGYQLIRIGRDITIVRTVLRGRLEKVEDYL